MRINGTALRTIRLDRDIALGALAKEVGVHYSHLANIEAGRRPAPAKLIKALAEALRVDVTALLGPEDPAASIRELVRALDLSPADIFPDCAEKLATPVAG